MCRLRMCHNRYIEYTLMYIRYAEYNEYSFMYFITKYKFFIINLINKFITKSKQRLPATEPSEGIFHLFKNFKIMDTTPRF